MKGILYGVGVGPGDPELMTLKAVRMIRENEVIAAAGAQVEDTVAYQIAVQAVPELADKELLPVYMPMTHDRRELEENHAKGAKRILSYLEQGKNVVFLTLGDPVVYSTFTYLQKRVEDQGYETAFVSGITSFCAAAARLNLPLVEWNEPLHVIPGVHLSLIHIYVCDPRRKRCSRAACRKADAVRDGGCGFVCRRESVL